MRVLPRFGAFELLTCLDDAVNYLPSEGELRAAFEGFARNLAPGGLAVFDANTLATYRTTFAGDAAMESGGARFRLRGEGSSDPRPGELTSLWIEVLAPGPDGRARRSRTRHLQRHHPRADVERAAAAAGLEIVAVRGQLTGVRLEREPDEERHTKLVYVARRPA
jgi:predicted TPR repeat methyltransferase